MNVVVVDVDTLRDLVRDAVRDALAAAGPAEAAEWLDSEGAAAMLHVHPRTVAKLVSRSGLPAHRIGKLYRFRRSEIAAWLAERGVRGARAGRAR